MKRLVLGKVLLGGMLITAPLQMMGQEIDYNVEMQGSFSSGKTPLWLNANKYGLSSLEKTNGYVRAAVGKSLTNSPYVEGENVSESNYKSLDWGFGADVAVPVNYTSNFVVQQAFVEGRWHHGVLSVGAKEYPMELKNNQLSTGSQTLGINARPIPQVRLALPEYWTLPIANKWLHIKGHVAYGKVTDDAWQKDFTQEKSKYSENLLYHSKAGYLKVGHEDKPLSVEMGLEMVALFGGDYFRPGKGMTDLSVGVKDYWTVLWAAGGDPGEGEFANAEGNQMGSWVMRVNWNQPKYSVSLYADHYFDDHSQMFFLDTDGYTTGENWTKKETTAMYVYPLKDIMLGAEVKLKDCRWINDILVEYLYSKYQSGPIYHDHGTLVSYHVGGNDDYYNHGYYPYQHWGQAMGNPLYRSPIYNEVGSLTFENNRFVSWHLGVSGNPLPQLSYRVLATVQNGWGTYANPYKSRKRFASALAEVNYQFTNGWSGTVGLGADKGTILGDNFGVQLTIRKRGIFKF